MTPIIWVGLAIVVLAAVLIGVRSRRSHDGVDSFRRQIDALSPEARRPVIDQIQHVVKRPGGEAPEPGDGSDTEREDEDDVDGA